MNEAELIQTLRDEYDSAESYYQQEAEGLRDKVMAYYLGRPMGNEQLGRSQVIAREVFATVEGISTAITNLFVNEEAPVEFVGKSAGDDEKARLRTKVALHHLSQNGGFEAMAESIQDGVHLGMGALMWTWQKTKTVRQEIYKAQTQESLALLADNEDVRIVKQEPAEPIQSQNPETGEPIMQETWDVTCMITDTKGKAVLEAVPPEEILVTPRAKSPYASKAPVLIHRTLKTKADLLMEGYEPDIVENLNFTSSDYERRETDAIDAEDLVEIHTFWIHLDMDDDGIFEYRKIVMSDDVILLNEITDEPNIETWCPIPLPHEFYGRCPGFEAIQAQDIQTALWRQALDKEYRANHPMLVTSDEGVLKQLMRPEIGRPILAKIGQVEKINLESDNSRTLNMIEFAKADNENVTGFTRYAQGMDAKSLNQTATGVKIITNMSQERIKKMARLYANCFAKAVKGISKLLSQNCDKELEIRMNDDYITIDPREWKEEYDMAIKVGLGLPDRDEKIQAAVNQYGLQKDLMMLTQGQLVNPQNLYAGALKQLKAMGERTPEQLLTDPSTLPQPDPNAPPPTPPEIEKAQMELQADAQKFQAQAQNDQIALEMKLAADKEIEAMRLASKERIAMQDAELKNRQEIQRMNMMAKPQVMIDGKESIDEAATSMQAIAIQQNELLAQALQSINNAQQETAQLLVQVAQALTMPKTATLPNGKTITVQTGV
jgi:hypothetical protein